MENPDERPGKLCDLCGLPLRRAVVADEISPKTYRFCCPGCRQVFNLLLASGASTDPAAFRETELFQKCREIGIIPRSENDLISREKSLHPDESAGPCAGAPPVPKPSDGSQTTLDLTLKVDNMWCPACAWVIEAYLRKTAGIISADCNFSTDYLRCEYDPVATTPDAIMHTLQSLGYRPLLPGEKDSSGRRRDFIRFGVSAFLTANVMMLSFALYSGFFSELSAETIRNLSWPIFIMTTTVLSYGGYPLYRKAFAGFFSAAFGMETLVSIGSASAFLFSVVNMGSGSIHLYFDTACMLVTLVLLGKLLEKNAKFKVRTDIEQFFALRPAKVRICLEHFPDGRYVNAAQLQVGDQFIAAENETIAADGRVLQGEALVDASALSGEAFRLKAKAGDRVRCGATVISGRIRIKAEAVGDDSTVGQMIQVMERALGNKTPLEGKTDRLLRGFIPAILLLATASGAGCLLYGLSFEAAFVRTITVLVIACPCSLGIAIPLARVGGISLAGKSGILVRNFSGIEKSGSITAVVFDKTGTLTQGCWELQDMIIFKPFTAEQVLAWAAALEKDSNHAIAAAIRRHARKNKVRPDEMERIVFSENGISGWSHNGKIKIGSKDFLPEEWISSTNDRRQGLDSDGGIDSCVYMGCDGRLCAVFVFGDKIKPGAAEAVTQLHRRGYRTCLVSGDGNETTRTVAENLNIRDFRGGLLPQEKAAFIEQLQNEGERAAMVGDGINDAPALVQADLSVAVHSGSHLGREVADITLMRSDPLQVIDFLGLAERINLKIRQNLIFSFLYNAGSIPLAMSGLLNPLIAVSAMLLSSLTVIGNTLLLIRNHPPPAGQTERFLM